MQPQATVRRQSIWQRLSLFQRDRSVVAFDLTLGHRVVRRTSGVFHVLILQPFPEFFRDIAGPVIG